MNVVGNTNNNPSIILVIGNGFDLDLGLNTSYKAFIDKMYIKTQHPESTNTLIDAMIKKCVESGWIDYEECNLGFDYMGVTVVEFNCRFKPQLFSYFRACIGLINMSKHSYLLFRFDACRPFFF